MMPPNNGTAPPFDRVDLKFVNGHVERNQEPKKWRWTRSDPKFPATEWDIASWQRAA